MFKLDKDIFQQLKEKILKYQELRYNIDLDSHANDIREIIIKSENSYIRFYSLDLFYKHKEFQKNGNKKILYGYDVKFDEMVKVLLMMFLSIKDMKMQNKIKRLCAVALIVRLD
jgi:hypothetical protein